MIVAQSPPIHSSDNSIQSRAIKFSQDDEKDTHAWARCTDRTYHHHQAVVSQFDVRVKGVLGSLRLNPQEQVACLRLQQCDVTSGCVITRVAHMGALFKGFHHPRGR